MSITSSMKPKNPFFEISERRVRPSFYSIREIVKDSLDTIFKALREEGTHHRASRQGLRP